MEDFVEKCIDVIMKNLTKTGIRAGSYYPDTWGRDTLISTLGMVASGNEELMKVAKKCMDLLAKYRKFTGQIPNKVSPDGKMVCFGEGGCVDSSLWYPVAVLNYYRATGDGDFLERHAEGVNRALVWALCLDQNNDWLIETHDGSDWMDLLLRSGRVLYDNVLLYKAAKDVAQINKITGRSRELEEILENLKTSVNLFFWPTQKNLEAVRAKYGFSGIDKDVEEFLKNEGSGEEREFYIADIGFRKYDPRFDSLGNILAVLFDVADAEKKRRILNYIEKNEINKPFPVKALHPPIQKNDPFRCFYFRRTELPQFQEPGNYHNGGIWPFIGGFYVAALKKEKREWESHFERLVESCRLGNWRFSEWLTAGGKPSGASGQTWSAAMLLFAYKYAGK